MKLIDEIVAKAFINGALIDLSEFSLISREACKLLSEYKNDLDLSSLEILDKCSLETLAEHSYNLILPEHLIFNEEIFEYLDRKPGSINGCQKSVFAKNNLKKLKKIKYKKLTSDNYKELIGNRISFTSMSNDGALSISSDEGIECIKKTIDRYCESFEGTKVTSFGRNRSYDGNPIFRTPDLNTEGARALSKISKLYKFDYTVEARVNKFLGIQDCVSLRKLDEKSFVLWSQGSWYDIREIKTISTGAAKMVSDYEGDTGYGSLEFQGFYFDELEELSDEAKAHLQLSYHKIRMPEEFAKSIPVRLDLSAEVAEAYVNSGNLDVIKSYTHLCDESAARCLTYFKELDIVMPELRVMSTDCAQSLGIYHKQNLQINSLAKISACGLAELSKKQGTINGLNPIVWSKKNSHLVAS